MNRKHRRQAARTDFPAAIATLGLPEIGRGPSGLATAQWTCHCRIEIVQRCAGQPLRHGVRPPVGLTAGGDRRYRPRGTHDRAHGLVLGEVPAVPADPQPAESAWAGSPTICPGSGGPGLGSF